MGTTTWIKQAAWVVAWDAAARKHYFLRDADVVFRDNEIVFVGKGYDGQADVIIAGKDRMVLPGFIGIHSHPTSEPVLKGLSEERRSRRLGMMTIYEYMPLVGRPIDPDDTRARARSLIIHDDATRSAATKLALWEMLRSGVTTFTDYTPFWDGWIDEIVATGIRACMAPSFRSANWYTPNGHELLYSWDEPSGRQAFREALDVLDVVKKHPSGRLFGMMAPGQVDTCSAELLIDARDAARERGLPMQLHVSQSTVEFREIVRRHGKTPLEWLEGLGILGDNFIIGHGIFLDHHSSIRWHERRDLDRLAASGTSVAHCPNEFARGGWMLENLGLYRKKGINVGLGTDTYPHNFLEEMRWATILCKIAGADVDATSAAEVFHVGTVGSARALRREDIGRLAPGCKADLVLVDTAHPLMQPLHDPLRSLMFSALERAVRDVYVDGRQVVKDGKVLTIDVEAALDALNAGQRKGLVDVAKKDWAKRSAEEVFPLSLELR